MVGLAILFLAVLALGAFDGPAQAISPEAAQVTAEEREEQAEEAEEAAEEVAPVSAFAVAQPKQCSLRRTDAVASRIAGHKAYIRKIRQSIRFTRTLAHTTTRWLVHLPKKRAHIKALRQQIRALRAIQSACGT